MTALAFAPRAVLANRKLFRPTIDSTLPIREGSILLPFQRRHLAHVLLGNRQDAFCVRFELLLGIGVFAAGVITPLTNGVSYLAQLGGALPFGSDGVEKVRRYLVTGPQSSTNFNKADLLRMRRTVYYLAQSQVDCFLVITQTVPRSPSNQVRIWADVLRRYLP